MEGHLRKEYAKWIMLIIAWNENATGALEIVIKEEGKLGNVLKERGGYI
jgi:hypothetical protein